MEPKEILTYPEFKNFVIEGVQENWAKDKIIAPMIFLFVMEMGEPKIVIIPANDYMKTELHKDILSSVIQTVCKQLDVICYCILSESWISEFDPKDGVPPSESPDRKEIILLFFETKYNSETMYYEIIRDENTDDAVISDLVELESGGGGRFSNLLIDITSLN